MIKKILLVSMLCLIGAPAVAEEYAPAYDTIVKMNRIQPLQNPDLSKSADIINRRMLDRTNKVVGEVRDVLVSPNGSIEALNVDFNRLRLGAPVYLNYREMSVQAASDSYIVGFADNQIETLYPELLANVATAAGGDVETLSVKNVLGAEVKAQDGRMIGVVDDVLFSSNGDRADSLLINNKAGLMRGKTVAIPFGMADFAALNTGNTIILENPEADALLNFAAEK
jgi:sporulation protein YlmC with PRC-barrel domain